MLKLKLQYFGHMMRRADSLEKTLMLGKIRSGGEEDEARAGGVAPPHPLILGPDPRPESVLTEVAGQIGRAHV